MQSIAAPRVPSQRGRLGRLLLVLATLPFLEMVCRFAEPLYYHPRSADEIRFTDPPAFPKDGRREFRVFLYGGSTVEGANYGPTSFAAQLKYWLNARHPDSGAALYNFAVSSKASPFIARRVEETAGYHPDLAIVLCGHNEFMNRFDKDRFYFVRSGLNRSALVRAVELAWVRAYLASRQRSAGPDVRAVTAEQRAERAELFAANIRAIAAALRARGVPLLLCTAPSNVRDWPPRAPDALPPPLAAAQELLRRGQPRAARQRLEPLLRQAPQDAAAHFLCGRALLREGRLAQARPHLLLARDLDPAPGRASSALNEVVRQSTGPGVFVVDLERDFAEAAPDGLPGYDLIADYVHPSAQGSALIAARLVRAIEDHGLLSAAPSGPACDLASYLAWLDRNEKDSRLLYLIGNAHGSMRLVLTAWWDAADREMAPQRYLDAAVMQFPSRWEAWVNQATLSLISGQTVRGAQELLRASRLKGSPLQAGDQRTAPLLQLGLKTACPGLPESSCLSRLLALRDRAR